MPSNTASQLARAEAFQRLHQGPGAFLMPNPWDAGSARLLSQLGFAALATTSAGLAHSLGLPDGRNEIGRDQTLANARAITAASTLPVSADLESCFGTEPGGVGETIRQAADAGLVGGSIEDATGDADRPIQPFDVAVDRVREVVEAARELPFPFTVTARAENFRCGISDLDDTIRRLQAFEAAGADVLYAPGLPDLAAVRTVCAAVSLPVNVLAGPADSVAELAAAGVRRISLGSMLSRTALGALVSAAREMLDQATFGFGAAALPYPLANSMMAEPEHR